MVAFVIEVVRIANICVCFHFVQVVNDVLLLREDIDIN